MSKAIRCDCCQGTTPDINPIYSTGKKWFWQRYYFDSQGGSEQRLHICEKCWEKIGEAVRNTRSDT